MMRWSWPIRSPRRKISGHAGRNNKLTLESLEHRVLPSLQAVSQIADPSLYAATAGGQQPIGLSSDARYIVFQSAADNLLPGDHNGVSDVFVRDRQAGTTTLVSVAPSGSSG